MKKLLVLCLFSLLVSGGAYAHEHEKGHDDHDKAAHDSADANHKGKEMKEEHSDHASDSEKHDEHADGHAHDKHDDHAH